jgi:hypothetical protein
LFADGEEWKYVSLFSYPFPQSTPKNSQSNTKSKTALHFHLTLPSPTTSKDSYADTEFIYQPLLDEQRDAELLDLLPDYLTEEISFPRAHAAKFFGKVVDSMSKRIVLEEEEEEE